MDLVKPNIWMGCHSQAVCTFPYLGRKKSLHLSDIRRACLQNTEQQQCGVQHGLSPWTSAIGTNAFRHVSCAGIVEMPVGCKWGHLLLIFIKLASWLGWSANSIEIVMFVIADRVRHKWFEGERYWICECTSTCTCCQFCLKLGDGVGKGFERNVVHAGFHSPGGGDIYPQS